MGENSYRILGCSHLDCSLHTRLVGTGCSLAGRTEDSHHKPLGCSSSDMPLDRNPLHMVGKAGRVGKIVRQAGTSLRPGGTRVVAECC